MELFIVHADIVTHVIQLKADAHAYIAGFAGTGMTQPTDTLTSIHFLMLDISDRRAESLAQED